MSQLVITLPIYETKINEANTEKVDLNIRDLQKIYPNGCICCGTAFTPKKYSSMISQHFNTGKHKKKCLYPENQLFKQDIGLCNNLPEAFDSKCKELRELKKLNYDYKQEIDNIKLRCQVLEKLNIQLQERLSISDNKTLLNINCKNLIDL